MNISTYAELNLIREFFLNVSEKRTFLKKIIWSEAIIISLLSILVNDLITDRNILIFFILQMN